MCWGCSPGAGHQALSKAAAAFIAATDAQLGALLEADDVQKVECDGDEARA
ncbi:hypothetical protein [Roseomonas sp. CECT 9278]|uniref:hypothetical protein n=1 Tax=Roseomonas sp. CECT 9278 TaxID=2845823 RepID=UPI001E52D1F9|nr:hypothetical protein [Roseomonas sp. CECT 9278]